MASKVINKTGEDHCRNCYTTAPTDVFLKGKDKNPYCFMCAINNKNLGVTLAQFRMHKKRMSAGFLRAIKGKGGNNE